jgi:subtilisin family serine protease
MGSLFCAVDWITARAHVIDVANLSLGGPDPATDDCGIAPRKQDGDPFHAAICGSVAAGVTYVVAAGNASIDASTITPASYPEVITVSAISDTDGRRGGLGQPDDCHHWMADDSFATFSNFGAPIDIAAPGVCMTSTYPGGLYAYNSGTSFASPLVAGAAALYISTHPGATPAQVRAALLAAAEPGPIPGDPDAYPEGVVNVSGF